MDDNAVYDRCPKCKKNYIYGYVSGKWLTWYMFLWDAFVGMLKIQILYCPACGYELPNASADLEAEDEL